MSHRTLTLVLTTATVLVFGCMGARTQHTRCDTCPEGLLCDVATGACVAPASPDGGCSSNASCAAPTRLCAPDGRCVACLSNADCPQGSCDMQAGQCVAAAAESCGALSSFIDVTGSQLTLRGTTLAASNDAQLGCAVVGSAGPDVLFGVRVSQRRRLTATVRAVDPSSGFVPVVGVRTDCAAPRSELACGFSMPGGDTASLTTEVGQGSFFVWVDSESETGGEFELVLAFGDVPTIDACAAPGVLRGSDLLEATGETQGLSDDVAATCGGMGAPDAIYALTLDRPRRARVEVTGLSGFKPTASLRRLCSDAQSEVACAPAAPANAMATLEVPALEAGTWAVIVDGPPGGTASGRFRLRVSLFDPVPAPTNDTCDTALEVVQVSGGGPISLQGDTTRAKNDAVGCDGTGPELVYTLELPEPRHLKALVTPFAGARLQPLLYLRRDMQCQSEQTREQLHCVAAGQSGFPAQLDVPRLGAGRWFLFVDGKAGTSGAFDLSLELTPPPAPPANDTCATATVLPLASGPVFLPAETTVGATASAVTCVDTPQTADVAYSFTLSSRQSVSIDARALAGSRLLPAITLKPAGPCLLTAELPLGKCGYSDLQVPDRAVAIAPALDPGTYTIWVAGDLATQGPFSLRVVPGPALNAPANDACGSAGGLVSLSVGGTSTGDTRAAGNTTEGRCGLPLGANGELGADVAYTFQVAALTPTLTITVQPDAVGGALLRPVIYVRGGPSANNTCTSSGPNLGCQAAPDFGAPATLTLSNVMPGTYTLWVDGAGLSAGAFSLSVR